MQTSSLLLAHPVPGSDAAILIGRDAAKLRALRRHAHHGSVRLAGRLQAPPKAPQAHAGHAVQVHCQVCVCVCVCVWSAVR